MNGRVVLWCILVLMGVCYAFVAAFAFAMGLKLTGWFLCGVGCFFTTMLYNHLDQ